jgi:hypothetical protein
VHRSVELVAGALAGPYVASLEKQTDFHPGIPGATEADGVA